MPMKCKVTDSLKTLCATCTHATVVQFETTPYISCSMIQAQIKAPVTECSSYIHKNQPEEWKLKEIAWILKTNPNRTQIGFVPPGTEEHRKLIRHRYETD